MSKVEFKEFVKKNPHLISYVSTGKTTWQKLYELYDLYGETSTIWNNYQDENTTKTTSKLNNNFNQNQTNNNSNPLAFKELLNMVKGIDLNNVQKGLNSLDKAIEALKGIVPSTVSETPLKDYQPRPTYKYFED